MPGSDKSLTHRELEGPPKATLTIMGVFVMVKYDYRKGQDLYVASGDHPAFCCQCKEEFPQEQLQGHVLRYYRKRHVPPEVKP